MSIFQCEKCGCLENTTRGLYHTRNMDLYSNYQEGTEKGMKLCACCAPLNYSDGVKTEFGQWHGRFSRVFYKVNSLYTDGEGNVRNKDTDEYPKKEDELKRE